MNANAGKALPAVLIVDDDPVCRVFCVQALAALDYQTFVASDGASAIQMALRERPKVILIDMHLPDMSGAEAMACLLKLWPGAKADCRFIGLSGDDSTPVRSAMMTVGFAAILAKPFTIETLLECVRKTRTDLLKVCKTRVRSNGSEASISTPDLQQAPELHLQSIFRAELNQQLPELDRVVTLLDWQRAAEILHRLTGAAALAGYSAFAKCGRMLLPQLHQAQNIASLAETYLEFLRQATDLLADQPLDFDSGFRHYE